MSEKYFDLTKGHSCAGTHHKHHEKDSEEEQSDENPIILIKGDPDPSPADVSDEDAENLPMTWSYAQGRYTPKVEPSVREAAPATRRPRQKRKPTRKPSQQPRSSEIKWAEGPEGAKLKRMYEHAGAPPEIRVRMPDPERDPNLPMSDSGTRYPKKKRRSVPLPEDKGGSAGIFRVGL